MVSPISFLRSTLVTLEAENIFLHFITELKIHQFLIWHMRLSTLLILAVYSNGLAHLEVSVAQLQSIRTRRSEVHDSAFFLCLVLVTGSKKKLFSYVSKKNKRKCATFQKLLKQSSK